MKWLISILFSAAVTLLAVSFSTHVFSNGALPGLGDQSTQQEDMQNTSYYQPSEKQNREKETRSEANELQEEFTVLNSESLKESNAVSEDDEAATNDQGIEPVKVNVPAIGVDAKVEKVGLLDNGEMGVPDSTERVGWFEPGTKAGNVGNSVLAGHVDSYEGPAVFFDLKDLKKGDEIKVTNADGKELTFVVRKLKSYPYDDAPIEDIFGETDKRMLNLITCTGTFDQETSNHLERLVVFSELKEGQIEQEEPEPDPLPAPENVEVNGSFVEWHAVRDERVVG